MNRPWSRSLSGSFTLRR